MNNGRNRLFEQSRRRGISLDSAQLETLYRFAEQVFEKGTVLGLSGRTSLEDILEKDILDSLLLVRHLRANDQVLDIGPGAGFPGIPLKIAGPGIFLTVLEAKQKALKFLKETANEMNLNFEIFEGRAEESGNNPRLTGSFDLVTGRAVAPLRRFLPWAVPFLKPTGKLILLKGKKWREEFNASRPFLKKMNLAVKSVSPGLEGDQRIVEIRRRLCA